MNLQSCGSCATSVQVSGQLSVPANSCFLTSLGAFDVKYVAENRKVAIVTPFFKKKEEWI